jgi:hypothetical protein
MSRNLLIWAIPDSHDLENATMCEIPGMTRNVQFQRPVDGKRTRGSLIGAPWNHRACEPVFCRPIDEKFCASGDLGRRYEPTNALNQLVFRPPITSLFAARDSHQLNDKFARSRRHFPQWGHAQPFDFGQGGVAQSKGRDRQGVRKNGGIQAIAEQQFSRGSLGRRKNP